MIDNITFVLTKFLLDHEQGQQDHQYINAKLPKLPLDNKSFDPV